MASFDTEGSRLVQVRRRVALAKAGLVVAGALVFGAALAFSRVHYAGHPKQRLRPLAASPRFFASLQANEFEPGIVRRALSSPSAATKQS
jgi:hypothetical protein